MKVYNLAGEWQLRMDEQRDEGVMLRDCDDTITLPSTTAQAKKTLHGENQARETGFLTERYPFCGYAWYTRTVCVAREDVGRPMFLYLERTRMTEVWIDDVKVGECDSICAPHRYDISSAVKAEQFTIKICVSNVGYPTRGGHMTSPDTQTNWNGILGRMELQVFAPVDVIWAATESNPATGEIRITLETVNQWLMPEEREITVSGEYVQMEEEVLPVSGMHRERLHLMEGTHSHALAVAPGVNRQTVTVKVENILRFGEFTPCYGKLYIRCMEKKDALMAPVREQAEQQVSRRLERRGFWDGLTEYEESTVEAVFGFRDFTVDEHHFYINGLRTFLRGKHDGMIFPISGAAPMDVEAWLRVMREAKRFGINHYRFHTCCPPEAAFFAADLLGIYMEPELPFWGTIADVGEEGCNEAEQEYLIREGLRLMEAYGSHPSFVMMSLGNELWGSAKRLGEIIDLFRSVDKRHRYTSGSNNFQFCPKDIPEEEFFVGVRFDRDALIRGSYAMCDAPQGFVQTCQPNTAHSYDPFFDRSADKAEAGAKQELQIQYGTGVMEVKAVQGGAFAVDKPVVSHEVGQYCTYPDFREIDHYTGVLAPRNLEVFKERLAAAGMEEQAEEFFRNSGKLAAFCYKLELEAAHRSGMLAGYQLLDIQDFSGQGTATVGVLNALMEEKGTISSREWRGFCAPTVALAKLERFVYTQGERVSGGLVISHYGQRALSGATLRVVVTEEGRSEISFERRQKLFCEEYPLRRLDNGVHEAGSFIWQTEKRDSAAEYRLTLSLLDIEEDVIAENSYQLYTYPALEEPISAGEKQCGKYPVYVTEDKGHAVSLLKEGRRVLFLPRSLKNKVQGTFSTDFWCYPMFRSISESMGRPIPVGTLGLTIRSGHEALKGFGSHAYSTPQWYSLVMQSDCAILDGTAIRPIVQTIDNFERNHKLGMVFEAQCMGGKLLVCTSRLDEIADDVTAQNLYRSLTEYAASEKFAPAEELTEQEFEQILAEAVD